MELENCDGCIWEDQCMFSGICCKHYSPLDDFSTLDYLEDMADRLWDYQQMCEEYSDGNR